MVRAGQLATAHWRGLPDFMIIGAAKGGTTSLYEYLAAHPLVDPCRTKEVNYFDRPWNHARGERWYRSWFPTTAHARRIASAAGADRVWMGEATPGYFDVEHVPEFVQQTVPDVRLIASLREPTDRAWSHYRMRSDGGDDPRELVEILERELDAGVGPYQPERGQPASLYLWRGRYADILERWYDVFPPEQILLLRSEDLFADPIATYAQVCAHVGLPDRGAPQFSVANQSRGEREVPAEVRAWLDDYYAEPNRRLAELTDGAIVWPRDHRSTQVPSTSS